MGLVLLDHKGHKERKGLRRIDYLTKNLRVFCVLRVLCGNNSLSIFILFSLWMKKRASRLLCVVFLKKM